MTTKWDELKHIVAGAGARGDCMVCLRTVAAKELIAEVERYEEGMRSMACQLSAGGYNAKHVTAELLVGKVQWGIDNLANESGALIDELRAKVAQLTEENKRIRAANLDGVDWVNAARADIDLLGERLNQALERHRTTFSQLQQKKRECEELRKDAERYRFLRDIAPRVTFESPLIAMCNEDGSVKRRDHGCEMLLSGQNANFSIDEAMAKEGAQ